ncbi:hypothetical protein UFOVP1601_9 [uncultured Caudovirales phage]|uniref:Uncharacterized protein n=1 Tax=uncultured Caudovirales phage TaxID=2100421 RepID=A0A6J5S3T1_9CAUD|nr:hypothetical protein UFOVP1154_19 [uncultured Caudovirales phage]CAB4200036.1 hypothetical protein UFOVP1341_18 [uncultured Caudovirales phage]CAB4218278.1 hypothetical protein UFOVP1601_9 [uncultured Caudovirales phage]
MSNPEDALTPEDAALLAEAEEWDKFYRTGSDIGLAGRLINDLRSSLRASLRENERLRADVETLGSLSEVYRAATKRADDAERERDTLCQALRSIAEHDCMCCVGDCSCGWKHEQTAKDALAALQVDLKQE